MKDLPHRAGRDPVSQTGQLALNPSVAPARILPGQAQHQGTDLGFDRWPARCAVRVGPMSGEQLPMPAKEGGRANKRTRPAGTGQQPRQRRQHHSVGGLQLGARDLPAQDRYLVPHRRRTSWRTTSQLSAPEPGLRRTGVVVKRPRRIVRARRSSGAPPRRAPSRWRRLSGGRAV
jgi:hypothetical protein